MKIGSFAQAARTTARTVRHYHQLGLLPEPSRRANGYREYEFTDLVRLLRITWLARAGIPLAKIGDLLKEDERIQQGSKTPAPADSMAARDLELIAMTMAAERDRLDRQMTALTQIRESVTEGRTLSALPPRLAAALDLVATSATGPERSLVERDREMLEVMALSGELRAEMVDAYAALADDPAQLGEALRVGAAFAAIEGRRVCDVEQQIDELVDSLLAAPVVQQMLVGAESEVPTPEEAAFFLPDPAQREIVLRVLRRLS